jgi:F-type H+-transporting ATPase subunit b
MQSAPTATTQHTAHAGGFPPFDVKTFPSQIFWLAISFAVLFIVLWRFAGPMISSTIASRRKRINDDIAAAQSARSDADAASNAYEAALSAARNRAHTLADENRRKITAEVEGAKSEADRQAQTLVGEAERAIAVSQAQAKAHVTRAAQDAAAEIVQRLLREQVSPEDAAAAVRAAVSTGA